MPIKPKNSQAFDPYRETKVAVNGSNNYTSSQPVVGGAELIGSYDELDDGDEMKLWGSEVENPLKKLDSLKHL
jgi:hypothetical protein